MNINDFKTLLINRSEIEKILGKTISVENSVNDYLEDYRLFPELSLHDVTCLILNMWPRDWEARHHPRYETIKEAIKQSAERGYIHARIENDINGNIEDIFLTHEVAEKWARTYGLKWNVPPYQKPLEVDRDNSQIIELRGQSAPSINSTELQEEKAKNTQLQAENERLKAELKAQQDRMAELEQKLQQSAVDSEPVLGSAKATRISKIQRDIFTLLVLKNYQGLESRNALFDVINAELREQGINNKGASYQTFDNLIDENIRLTKTGLDGKQASHSPFPIKITK
ncbi:hypothetical protein [Haemophilus pittmaniae]|uniref:hypothetical protein n=1 Tax=Haemophilus pittmaniae TaxID=249188 RepID=UPI0028DC25A2|nr:hypothetical protein [Haemophilus pittmaniae]